MDTSQLTKSTVVNACIRAILRDKCPNYNPVQFKPGIVFDEITELVERGGYHCLVPQYEREGETFELSQLVFAVFNRFVQLLAPFTLHLYRTCSKHVYYQCLDIRGLDTRRMKASTYPGGRISIGDGFVNTSWNPLEAWETQFTRYQICHGELIIMAEYYPRSFSTLNFVKKYKTIHLIWADEFFLDNCDAFCDAAFHPGVEHVEVSLTRFMDDTPSAEWLKNFGKLLGYCKNARSCDFDNYRTDPMTLEIKSLVEEWAVTAVNLEVFVYSDCVNFCQLHKGKLKYCCEIGGELFLLDNILDGHSSDYAVRREFTSRYRQIPEQSKYIRYEDAIVPYRETLNPRMVTVEATQIKTAEAASESDDNQLATNGGIAALDDFETPSAMLNILSVANNKSGPKNDVKKDQNQKKPAVPQTQNQKNNQSNDQNKNTGQQNNQAKTVAPANRNQNQQNKRKSTANPAASVSPAKRARVPYPVSPAVNPFQRNNQNQQAKKQAPSLVRIQNRNAAGYGRQQQQQFRQQPQQPFQQPYVEPVPPWYGSQYPPVAVAVTPGYGGHGHFPQPPQVLQIPQQQQIPPPHNSFGPGNYPPMQQRTWR